MILSHEFFSWLESVKGSVNGVTILTLTVIFINPCISSQHSNHFFTFYGTYWFVKYKGPLRNTD